MQKIDGNNSENQYLCTFKRVKDVGHVGPCCSLLNVKKTKKRQINRQKQSNNECDNH